MRLEGKVALVTGATRGIGKAIALRFAGEGAKVVVAGRTEKAGNAVAADIVARGGEGCFVRTDIGQEADVRQAVETALDRYGKLTTLVNNAAAVHLVGMPEKGDTMVTELRNEVFSELLQTNVWGTIWCCKYAIAELSRSGGGAIVNISSNVAIRGVPFMDGYTATKGALNAITRSMAVEYAKQRVRVNAISVGFVQSGPDAEAFAKDPVRSKWLAASIPAPFFGEPDDIAWGAVYLASDEARYVSGALLPIDGGAAA